MNEKYFTDELVQVLWTKIKVELATKAGVADLDDYLTLENFATQLATALANYATKEQVNAAVSGALTREVVDALPEISDASATVIYLVPAEKADDKNVKDEYMLINGKWELIGTTKVDLSGYWSKTELEPMTEAELNAILV